MKFLVPTDLSPESKNLVAYASALAADLETKSSLDLLHVYTPSLSSNTPIHGIIAEETAVKTLELKQEMEVLYDLSTQTPRNVHVAKGETVEQIINQSVELASDVILTNTHGAVGFRKAIFGSNAANLIKNSPVPVLTIPLHQVYEKIETIVYASDLKNVVHELKQIIPFARELNATIELFNIFEDAVDPEVKMHEVEAQIQSLSYAKIKIVEQVYRLELGVLEQIQEYLLLRKPQILVMFPREKSWFDDLFSSGKTEEMAYRLSMPLLSIRS